MNELVVRSTDYHTAGEPFRIVADPPVRLSLRATARQRELVAGFAVPGRVNRSVRPGRR
jgi:hypothetical protein